MKRATKTLLGLIVYTMTLAVLAATGGMYWLSEEFTAKGPHAEKVLLSIPKGSSLNAIAEILQSEGVIDHAEMFVLASRVLRTQSDLQAGEFAIPPLASPKEIMAILKDGKAFARQITVPEGLTSYQVMQLINKKENLTGTISDIPEEGSLLPETYAFKKNEPRSAVVSRMQRAMQVVLNEAWKNRAEGLPIKSKQEALILASIIEKETGKPGEHARVAGVFINRLKKNMKLQTDPTVIYGLTGGVHDNAGQGPLGRRLLRKDLGYDSLYNTYLYAGLPPGPIANPGIAAIRAALNPENHEYIYFVADGTGGHAFGKTLDEHNRNVAKWRRIRDSQ